MAKVESEIKKVTESLNKLLGAGTVISFEDEPNNISVISSGSIALDSALGGGYPLGRVVEIFGPESSGKTTLAIEAMVEAQKLGSSVAMLDVENAFDPDYAESLGLDLSKDKMIFSQPETGEDTFTILEQLIGIKEIGIIVVDSIAAMIPKAELEGEFGESKMGLHARLMSQGMRKLVGKIKKSNTLVIFINQIRMKIGVMFGNPETTTGGQAMRFYASQRVEIRKAQGDKDRDGEFVTNVANIKVVKNKIAPPFRKAKIKIRFGEGIDRITELIEYCSEYEIIKKSGSWYSFESTKLGQGLPAARETILENPELEELLFEEIKKLIE